MNNIKFFPKATAVIILLNVLGFINQDFALCSVFKHRDFNHLSSNMTCLFFCGWFLEDKIGWKRFLVFYLLSVVGSKMLWHIMDGRPSAGASGAICGIIGIDICYFFRYHRSKIKIAFYNLMKKTEPRLRTLVIILYVLGVIYLLGDLFSPHKNSARWAHAGGFLTGLIIGRMNKFKDDATNVNSSFKV